MEINKDAYNAYVKEVTPVNPVWKNIVRAFVTGGIICTIGQAVLNWLMSYGMDEKTAAAWNLDSGIAVGNTDRIQYISQNCEVGRRRGAGAYYRVC